MPYVIQEFDSSSTQGSGWFPIETFDTREDANKREQVYREANRQGRYRVVFMQPQTPIEPQITQTVEERKEESREKRQSERERLAEQAQEKIQAGQTISTAERDALNRAMIAGGGSRLPSTAEINLGIRLEKEKSKAFEERLAFESRTLLPRLKFGSTEEARAAGYDVLPQPLKRTGGLVGGDGLGIVGGIRGNGSGLVSNLQDSRLSDQRIQKISRLEAFKQKVESKFETKIQAFRQAGEQFAVSPRESQQQNQLRGAAISLGYFGLKAARGITIPIIRPVETIKGMFKPSTYVSIFKGLKEDPLGTSAELSGGLLLGKGVSKGISITSKTTPVVKAKAALGIKQKFQVERLKGVEQVTKTEILGGEKLITTEQKIDIVESVSRRKTIPKPKAQINIAFKQEAVTKVGETAGLNKIIVSGLKGYAVFEPKKKGVGKITQKTPLDIKEPSIQEMRLVDTPIDPFKLSETPKPKIETQFRKGKVAILKLAKPTSDTYRIAFEKVSIPIEAETARSEILATTKVKGIPARIPKVPAPRGKTIKPTLIPIGEKFKPKIIKGDEPIPSIGIKVVKTKAGLEQPAIITSELPPIRQRALRQFKESQSLILLQKPKVAKTITYRPIISSKPLGSVRKVKLIPLPMQKYEVDYSIATTPSEALALRAGLGTLTPQRLSLEQLRIPRDIIKNKPILDIKIRQEQKRIPILIPRQKQIPIQTNVPDLDITFREPPPEKPTRTSPPEIPPLLGKPIDFSEEGRKRKKRGLLDPFASRYVSSILAAEMGIFGKKPKRITGIEIRPLIKIR